jgi:hypothetical protein
MRRNALWAGVVFVAAVVSYLAGAGMREGRGNPAEAPPRPPDLAPPPVAEPKQAAVVPEEPSEPEPPPPVAAVEPTTTAEPALRDPPSGAAGYLRDDLERGGAMGLLHGLMRGTWSVSAQEAAFGIVDDLETFATAFAPHVKGPVLDGRTADMATVPDGTTLEYPEGVFEMRWSWGGRFPRDLVVRGAGKDRTLVRLAFAQVKSDEVHGLMLLDLTVDCRGKELLNLQSGFAAIRLERCRVARLGTLLRAEAASVLARECDFEEGTLLGVGRAVARFDGCTLRGYVKTHETGHVACLLRGCSFLDAPPDRQSMLVARAGVHLEECTFKTAPGIVPPRPLSSFNPAWPD